MKVKDLINQLKNYSEDLEVKFCYDYGDYWHTEVAKNITDVSDGHSVYSDYHRTDKVAKNGEDDESKAEYCVLIS